MGALTETPKLLMIDSTRNDSTYYDLDENDAEEDPKRNPLVATHTSDRNKIKFTDTDNTNRNYLQKLLINRIHPIIIPPIDPRIANGIAAGRDIMHVRQMPASKMVIVTDTAREFSGILGT